MILKQALNFVCGGQGIEVTIGFVSFDVDALLVHTLLFGF